MLFGILPHFLDVSRVCFHVQLHAGVGQSLYSSHLDAVYSPNHKFIDPQIWFDETEMRKQVEQAAGCMILTAQEAPETSRRMREDLYKKTMSADGIAGRRPYGLMTRMIELIGWKRFEVNKLIRFMGVTEHNFPSILRRSFVWKPKARFINQDIISTDYPDANLDGYFRKDDGLKMFLKSSVCILAALRLQHAFETLHSRDQCYQIIEDYATQPFTEDMMREACSLPAKKRSNLQEPHLQIPIDPPSQDKEGDLHDALWSVADAIRGECLAKGKSVFTKGMFKYLKLPPEHPSKMDRDTMWTEMLARKVILKGEDDNRFKDGVVPGVRVKKPILDILPLAAGQPDVVYTEIHDKAALQGYVSNCPGREANVATMLAYIEASVKELRTAGRRGKQPPATAEKIANLETLESKISHAEVVLEKILGREQARGTGDSHGETPTKRVRKKSVQCLQDVEQSQFVYHRNFDDLLRTRAYVQGMGAQACPRRVRRLLCPKTYDLDIQNCVFVVLEQLVGKLGVTPAIPDFVQKTLEKCAKSREEVCIKELGATVASGKKILHEVLFGGGIPQAYLQNTFMIQFQKTARYLRWLACSLIPDVYERTKDMADKKHPQASTLFYLYAAVEDCILQSWETFLRTQTIGHMSLHFDGVLVGLPSGEEASRLCQESADAILKETGFSVKILRKSNLYFCELCQTPCERSEEDVEDVLLQDGNCIPLAIVRLFPSKKDVVLLELAKQNQVNREASMVGSRFYKQCLEQFELQAAPSLGINLHKPGLYLLHAEHDGAPHCVSCKLNENGVVEIGDGRGVTKMTKAELERFGTEAIDNISIVTLRVFDKTAAGQEFASLPQSLSLLLGLRAGAGELDEDWAECLQNVCECEGPEAGSEDECEVTASDEDEPLIKVGDSLLAQFRKEVEQQAQTVSDKLRCPLCPFRKFQKPRRVRDHIVKYHTAARQYICSGTKQLKICCALFDNDQIRGDRLGNFLARSAELLRTTVKPPLSSKVNEIDREIRLVLTGQGPEYWSLSTLKESHVRRVRNLYYTREFADIVYQELLLCYAKCKTEPRQCNTAT